MTLNELVENKVMDDHHMQPGITFYLKVEVNNLDGTHDFHCEATHVNDDLDEMVADVKEGVRTYSLTTYIYECRPVRKIECGPVRVHDLTKKK